MTPSAVAPTPPPVEKVADLMEPPIAVFNPDTTVAAAIEAVRTLARTAFFTYGYICDASGALRGVVTMRDLLLAAPTDALGAHMLPNPFSLRPDTPLLEAMKQTANRQYPSYPVCTDDGRLVGIVRGARLFEQQAFEISAQAGSMLGVEKEERVGTPWRRSLWFRHPWLQVNLLTAFIAAAVVGAFEQTLSQIVVLTVFLPVLMGQSGNTGCQALAVALRGLTLGDLPPGSERRLVAKEALLGLCNGALVGLTAAAGMVAYSFSKHTSESPWALGAVVWFAMIASCLISGVCGALTPLFLRKVGADPATASSIFVTTITDVVSMASFLGLASWWLR